MSRRPLSDDDVSSLDDHRHSVGVEQLTVSLPDLSELELEIPEYLKEVRKSMQSSEYLSATYPSLSNTWILWLLVSATMISLSSVTATPLGSVNCPSKMPNSPNLQW